MTGLASLRYGWLGVSADACEVAVQVGALLTLRGWAGRLRPCGDGCLVRVGRAA